MKINLEDFDAVAFDVEGTLADTIPTHHSARLEAFKSHGFFHITRKQHELGPTYGSSSADIIGGILHAAGEIQNDIPFKTHPIVQEIITSKMQLFEQIAAQGFNEMPGAIDFVRIMANSFKERMALVTSSPERFVLPFLARYGIKDYFAPELIIGEDTLITQGLEGKPEPDPYQLAMKRLSSKSLLVFEDTVSGVASAKAAGATVVALTFEPNNSQLFKEGKLKYPPDFVVESYAQAKELFSI